MTKWQNYLEGKDPDNHSVVGAVRIASDVYSPQLNNSRDILVYLPPTYHSASQHYPVLYMHDGQNLFDQATSFVGEWQVDETLETLVAEGIQAIVVGIPNAGKDRILEYSPYETRWGKGKGEAYLRFITETIKPLIDSTFRTLPDREHTGIAGSSMGGLISLYGYLRYPQVFGFTGIMSPAFWLAGNQLVELIRHTPYIPGKIYLDIGKKEIAIRRKTAMLNANQNLTNTVRQVYAALIDKGYRPKEQILYVEDEEGTHQESAWARRLPTMLRFLIPPQPETMLRQE